MATSLLAAATTEAPASLPMPPAAFGITAIVVFAVLLVATLAFRNAGRRH
jgi:hypothetical protein